jgi:hypothetical protein
MVGAINVLERGRRLLAVSLWRIGAARLGRSSSSVMSVITSFVVVMITDSACLDLIKQMQTEQASKHCNNNQYNNR